MTITSFYYLVMIGIGVLLYYILPKSWQWVELLLMSLIFYWFAATPYTIIYLITSTVLAYISTNFAFSNRAFSAIRRKIALGVGVFAVGANVVLWFAFKGSDLWLTISYSLSQVLPVFGKITALPYLAALGMGYYTLQIIGYILDCYWENVKPQKNPLKLFLFVCFFPQMTTGPISRYSQLESLFEKHTFSYQNISFGSQRILWGLLKKLVLAERVGIIVNGIWSDYGAYMGYYRWIAVILFPIQMYADFSGCMDIVIGTAEIFGIKLPENFNSPFFSRTAQEFWQRWHITLGTWAKDYVLYPLLKSSAMIKFTKVTKKKFGKRTGKFISTALGMFALWMIMGIWHGAWKYIIGVSLWYWILLMLGELCSPVLRRLTILLKIQEDSFSWHLFQSIRTFLIYAIGATFFRAPGIKDAVLFLCGMFTVFFDSMTNPWVLFDGSILKLGVSYQDINIIIFSILLIIIVGVLREKSGYARLWMAKQILVFRWIIWIGLFIFVLIYGKYGPGYSAAEFIYKGF